LLTLTNRLKEVLLNKVTKNFKLLFEFIDCYRLGKVDPDRLLTFLRRYKSSITEEDIMSIFRRISFGDDVDF
jgi:hypothetical protein